MFDEPDRVMKEHVYLVKEYNKPTEQTFEVEIKLRDTNFMAVIEENDISFENKNITTILTFEPDQDKLELDLFLYPNTKVEGNKKYLLESKSINVPKYTEITGSSVFRTKSIIIRDNDRKFRIKVLIC